ncbi:hypothetical protein M0638_22805 [Roseomonas sp. NAR14]|uniref:Uncharacterized protein n=1 Tax=Roseomonas acroporae TaxID=2937791 RepID=A0A9X1YCF0_9PROT|nr:hypothetical protein [Roseomonas acroporae]MCK8787207.1 hypothetical protein [Roseomonas acroporae]
MPPAQPTDPSLAAFVDLCGDGRWRHRLAEIGERARALSRQGRAIQQRHALELALARLRAAPGERPVSAVERRLLGFAEEAVRLSHTLPPEPRERLRQRLLQGLTGEATLIPLFHLLRTAALHRANGFAVHFSGLAEETAHDLVIARDGAEAEVSCGMVSAEEGRPVHRGDWHALVDAVNPELQTWLAAHPGRYLLKITLPEGLSGPAGLAELHRRISDLLQAERRQDASQSAVLKLDPLVLAGAQVAGLGLPAHLRAQFGPEAHLAITGPAMPGSQPGAASGSVFVMAARAGREDAIATAVCHRMREAATSRLSGTRPGILAMFVEDVERGEWRGLRERLELEGAARRFLTEPAARPVVAVTCASRFELLGLGPPDAAPAGELRFRNPGHPSARLPALAPAILSTS